MTKRLLLILSSLLFLSLVAGLALFFYFQPTFYTPPPPVDFQMRIYGGEVVGREGGEVRWRLFVEEMEEVKGDKMTFTQRPYGEFYRQGEVQYTIVSDSILYHVKTGDLEFIEDVILETPEGDRLTSDLLLWDEKLQEISSPGPVQLFMGENRLEADGMKGYHQEDIFDFWDHVVLSIPVSRKDMDEGEREDE